MARNLLVAVKDLIFLARIRETASAIGAKVVAGDLLPEPAAVAEAQPVGILLDLNSSGPTPAVWVRALKAHPATRRIPIVAFASHVQSELIAEARAAGCDQVLARSAFSQQLPRLLRELLGNETEAPK